MGVSATNSGHCASSLSPASLKLATTVARVQKEVLQSNHPTIINSARSLARLLLQNYALQSPTFARLMLWKFSFSKSSTVDWHVCSNSERVCAQHHEETMEEKLENAILQIRNLEEKHARSEAALSTAQAALNEARNQIVFLQQRCELLQEFDKRVSLGTSYSHANPGESLQRCIHYYAFFVWFRAVHGLFCFCQTWRLLEKLMLNGAQEGGPLAGMFSARADGNDWNVLGMHGTNVFAFN